MARCFVIQGLGKKTDYASGRVRNLDASYAIIKEAVEQAGHECLRADEIVHSAMPLTGRRRRALCRGRSRGFREHKWRSSACARCRPS